MTTMAKKETVQRNWYVLDAAGKPLGRTAVTAAKLLRGKHKVDFPERGLRRFRHHREC